MSDAVSQTDRHEGMMSHMEQGDVAVLVIHDEEDLKVESSFWLLVCFLNHINTLKL